MNINSPPKFKVTYNKIRTPPHITACTVGQRQEGSMRWACSTHGNKNKEWNFGFQKFRNLTSWAIVSYSNGLCSMDLVQHRLLGLSTVSCPNGSRTFHDKTCSFRHVKGTQIANPVRSFVERNSVGVCPPFRLRTVADLVSKRRTVLNKTGRTKCRNSAILVQCTLQQKVTTRLVLSGTPMCNTTFLPFSVPVSFRSPLLIITKLTTWSSRDRHSSIFTRCRTYSPGIISTVSPSVFRFYIALWRAGYSS